MLKVDFVSSSSKLPNRQKKKTCLASSHVQGFHHDTEYLKNSYEKLVRSYQENGNKFKDNSQLDVYFQTRIKLQTSTGVYIPNIAQPDIDVNEVTKNNYTVLPLAEVKPDVQKKIKARILKAKRILHESRCIAYAVAFANKNPTVKNRLYWKMKMNCVKFETLKLKRCMSWTLLDNFQRECFFIGKERFKTPDQLWTSSEGLYREMVSLILNPTHLKSLMSIYSPLYSVSCGIIELKELIEKAPTVSVNPKTVPIKQTTPAVGIHKKISETQNFEQTVSNRNASKSATQMDSNEQVTKTNHLEDTLTSSNADSSYEFVDKVIKLKEEDTEELKAQYINYVETYNKCGSFESLRDKRDFQECRNTLQIATGVYLHNVYSPDIQPCDIKFDELSQTYKYVLHTIRTKQIIRAVNNLKEELFKSMCIANGLSILRKNPVRKQIVDHKLKTLNNTFIDSNERSKLLCTALDRELFNIGVKHLKTNAQSLWNHKSLFFGEIVPGVKRSSSCIASLSSIYSPKYNLEEKMQQSSINKKIERRLSALSKTKETESREIISKCPEQAESFQSQNQGANYESEESKCTVEVQSTSGNTQTSRKRKKNKKKTSDAEAYQNKIRGWLENAKLPSKLKPTRQSGLNNKGRKKQVTQQRARSLRSSLISSREKNRDKLETEVKFVKENELNENNDSGMEYSDEFKSDSENDEVV